MNFNILVTIVSIVVGLISIIVTIITITSSTTKNTNNQIFVSNTYHIYRSDDRSNDDSIYLLFMLVLIIPTVYMKYQKYLVLILTVLAILLLSLFCVLYRKYNCNSIVMLLLFEVSFIISTISIYYFSKPLDIFTDDIINNSFIIVYVMIGAFLSLTVFIFPVIGIVKKRCLEWVDVIINIVISFFSILFTSGTAYNFIRNLNKL